MELEEWISSFTRVSLASVDGENSQNNDELFGVFFEQTNNNFENLQRIIENGEIHRQKTDTQMASLIDIVERMASSGSETSIGQSAQTALNSKSLEVLVNSQAELLSLMSNKVDEENLMDEDSRNRLRNIDIQLARIHEELSAGRQDTLAEVRSDIAALSNAIISLVETHVSKERK